MSTIGQTFVSRVGVELVRAERYRIFVALTLVDLSSAHDFMDKHALQSFYDSILEKVRGHLRACDFVSFVNETQLGLLFPETSRQGAEVAIKRVTSLIQDEFTRVGGKDAKQIIPTELASYPDAAGTRTVAEFLDQFQHRSRN